MMSFRYILRYLIDPQFEAAERVAELVSFCQDSRIEEVMLFITAEELSTGHPTEEEVGRYIELGKSLKKELDQAGIALSLNPWSTVYHNFRGRTLREGQNFRCMVGESGATNPVAVCPLCTNWQEYLQKSFSRMVAGIQPVTLWVEDDWRLMNHDASLGWGGCFCDEHLRIFSSRVGHNVTREELLQALLQPGEPHPWRKMWMELSCETLRQPLEKISHAIRSANPGTRVALMSSAPDAHSVEGRDWKKFQEAIGCEPTFMTRPNMAPYTQLPAISMPPTRTRMTIANLQGPLEIYPELENSPRCGAYSKSAKYSAWQMMHGAFIGSHGITINHYDMLGNGTSLDPDFGKELSRKKKFLNAIATEEIEDRNADGVGILFAPDISSRLHVKSANAKSLSHLMQESKFWGEVAGILGIAYHFVSSIEKIKGPVLVNGQTLRAFNKEELRQLFRGSVLLDAEAVVTALDMGLGDLIGIEAAEWRTLRETGYSYEEILEEDTSVYGLRNPRMSAQRCSPELLSMAGVPGAKILSHVRKFDHALLWPGSFLFRNALGGNVVSLTYPASRAGQFFMGFFNVFRQKFLQRLFWQMAPQAPLAMASDTPLHCYRIPRSNALMIALTNPTDDPTSEVTLDLPSGETSGNGWSYLDEEGNWNPIRPEIRTLPLYDRLRFPISLHYLDGTLLRWIFDVR